MIRIVSGPIDSGKTARMEQLYAECAPGSAAGFVSRKLFLKGEFIGYEVEALAQGGSEILAMLATHYDGRFSSGWQFDRFIFSAAGFAFGTAIVAGLLAEGFEGEIFIDEVGPLELEGQGFAPALRQALATGGDLTISVRDSCREEVVAQFGIRQYQLIEVSDR